MPRVAASPKTDETQPVTARGKKAAPETRKRVAPVRSTRKDIDVGGEVGQVTSRKLPATGKARLEPTVIQPVESGVTQEKLELLAFMEEKLRIVVHDSSDPNADPMPTVWNDGIPQRFIPGQETEVKRKYVEILARSRKTAIRQVELPNLEGYENIQHSALVHPFSVLYDPNPKGAQWLKQIMQQG